MVEIIKSFTFVDPFSGRTRVLIKNNRFVCYRTNRIFDEIHYYGNFETMIGRALKAKITNDGYFVVTHQSSEKHTKTLEIIHPSYGLILISRYDSQRLKLLKLSDYPIEFIELSTIPSQKLSVALMVTVSSHALIDNTIIAIPPHQQQILLGTFIENAYQGLPNARSRAKLHLGLLTLEMIQPVHFSLIKNFLAEVITATISNATTTINAFSISETHTNGITHDGGIILTPTHGKFFRELNARLRYAIDWFNRELGTNYSANDHTGEAYNPHISLIPADVFQHTIRDSFNIKAEAFANLLQNTLPQLSIEFNIKQKYKTPTMSMQSRSCINYYIRLLGYFPPSMMPLKPILAAVGIVSVNIREGGSAVVRDRNIPLTEVINQIVDKILANRNGVGRTVDILALQEVDSTAFPIINQPTRQWVNHAFAKAREVRLLDYGNAIVSRFNIYKRQSPDKERLGGDEAQPDGRPVYLRANGRPEENRVALMVKLHLNADARIFLWMVVVHLGLSETVRTIQLDRLLSVLATFECSAGAAVICGDFNIRYHEDKAEFSRMNSRFSALGFTHIGGNMPSEETNHSFTHRLGKLDYMFFRNSTSPQYRNCEINFSKIPLKNPVDGAYTDHDALALDLTF